MESGMSNGASIIALIFLLVVCVVLIAAQWRIFEKMGIAGWKCLIPFYNSYCQCEKLFGNGLYFLVCFAGIIPVIGGIVVLLFTIITILRLAKSFGKGGGFVVGLLFLNLIFLPILAFGSSEYEQLPDWDIHTPFE